MNSKLHAPLSINFLIVGGGIAGLACALALRRVGHGVTVLEKDLNADGDGSHGGVRLPPNGSKILFDWGLEEELQQIVTKTDAALMFLYDTGTRLGKHVWSEEILKECRGETLYTRHVALRRLLYHAATSAGARVRWNTRVARIDADKRTVTLLSGEVLRARIIIGADGEYGVSRKKFLPKVIEDSGSLRMYHTTIPKNLMMRDPDLAYFWEPINNVFHLYAWFGNGRCMIAFPVGGPRSTEALAMYVYGPPIGTEGSWNSRAAKDKMIASLGNPEPRIKKMMKMATPPKSMPVKNYVALEDWVHDGGGMVLVGEAAHPIACGGVQGTALSLEDAAVLAKIFSHLSCEDQIPSFLYAFQDLRIPRCTTVAKSDASDIMFMTLAPGEMQAGRDNMMRNKDAAGLNVLDPEEGDDAATAERWEWIKYIFGYDAEDDADNWWVQWGLLAIRAKGADALGATGRGLEFSIRREL